jgi:adenylosuccinate lyase
MYFSNWWKIRNKRFTPFFLRRSINQIPRIGWNWIFHRFMRITLPQLEGVKPSLFDSLRNIYKKLYWRCPLIKETEKVTNHDVKVVLYQRSFWKLDYLNTKNSSILVLLSRYKQYCDTTFDKGSLWTGLYAFFDILNSKAKGAKSRLGKCSDAGAHAHGQPASPTGLGKEIAVLSND